MLPCQHILRPTRAGVHPRHGVCHRQERAVSATNCDMTDTTISPGAALRRNRRFAAAPQPAAQVGLHLRRALIPQRRSFSNALAMIRSNSFGTSGFSRTAASAGRLTLQWPSCESQPCWSCSVRRCRRPPQFQVSFSAGTKATPVDGRLILVVSREMDGEPRHQVGGGSEPSRSSASLWTGGDRARWCAWMKRPRATR